MRIPIPPTSFKEEVDIPQSDHAIDSLLDKIRHTLDSLEQNIEENSLSALKKEVDEAIDMEVAIKELSRDEIDLIAAYLKRDAKHLADTLSENKHDFLDWLYMDMEMMESKVLDSLSVIADKTQLDFISLQQRLGTIDHVPVIYVIDELVTEGEYRCSACEHSFKLEKSTHIKGCHICHGKYFERMMPKH